MTLSCGVVCYSVGSLLDKCGSLEDYLMQVLSALCWGMCAMVGRVCGEVHGFLLLPVNDMFALP